MYFYVLLCTSLYFSVLLDTSLVDVVNISRMIVEYTAHIPDKVRILVSFEFILYERAKHPSWDVVGFRDIGSARINPSTRECSREFHANVKVLQAREGLNLNIWSLSRRIDCQIMLFLSNYKQKLACLKMRLFENGAIHNTQTFSARLMGASEQSMGQFPVRIWLLKPENYCITDFGIFRTKVCSFPICFHMYITRYFIVLLRTSRYF
jgi:hypothetical protein